MEQEILTLEGVGICDCLSEIVAVAQNRAIGFIAHITQPPVSDAGAGFTELQSQQQYWEDR